MFTLLKRSCTEHPRSGGILVGPFALYCQGPSRTGHSSTVPDRLQCRAAGRGQVSANTVGLAVTKLSDRQELAQGSEAQYGDADERPGCRDLRDVETARACSS